MVAFAALLVGVAAACGGHPSRTATTRKQTVVIRQLASIQHRLKKHGYGPFYNGGTAGSILAALAAPPPRTSFYVPMDFTSVHHPYYFCVFVFRTPQSAARFAHKLESPSFRPNPWTQSIAVTHGSVVYWGTGGTLIRQPPPGQKPRYYGFDIAEFRHLVAVAEGVA
ncbi:MAG: hypothetical protein ACREJM_05355 [Candidatus Saccharimonadales bacterium]